MNEGSVTCLLIKDEKIEKTLNRSGIGSIILMYESGLMPESFIVDRIIGKAAAMILVLGRARACYGKIMSKAALAYLQENGIEANYGTLVDQINNRAGDGICPMEQTVHDIEAPAQALEALKNKVEELRKISQGKL